MYTILFWQQMYSLIHLIHIIVFSLWNAMNIYKFHTPTVTLCCECFCVFCNITMMQNVFYTWEGIFYVSNLMKEEKNLHYLKWKKLSLFPVGVLKYWHLGDMENLKKLSFFSLKPKWIPWLRFLVNELKFWIQLVIFVQKRASS